MELTFIGQNHPVSLTPTAISFCQNLKVKELLKST